MRQNHNQFSSSGLPSASLASSSTTSSRGLSRLEDQSMDRGKRRTMNSLIAERDWSVQEAMNVLNDEDMVVASRFFQNVDLRHPDHNEAQARVGADGVPTQCRSLYSKYLNRPVSEF
ncbi:hypothetical protein E4U50_006802 [Claviceps purpurea]|nr:hypothetical protein E4U50_006802 [Claviceps purpurea]